MLSANLLVNANVGALGRKNLSSRQSQSGVVGLILSDLADVTAVKNLAGYKCSIRFAQPRTPSIGWIAKPTDCLVEHQGYEQDLQLAQQIRGADVIIGGHSHTRLPKPVKENGVLIVQTGSKTTALVC